MKNFLNAYKNISETAELLINIGTKISFGVLAVGLFAYKYNEWFISGFKNEIFSFQIIMTAWNMFVIFILGGLLIDCVDKQK